jgi:hypothetical protein
VERHAAPPEARRRAFLDVVLNAAVPTIVFLAATRRAHLDEGHALVLAAIFPAAVAAAGLLRRRTLDPVAGTVLFGLAVSGVGLALGGGPRILLIRESFTSAGLALACFGSFALPRPLMFYFGRWFATHGEPRASARYDALWSLPGFRTVNRRITLVWGCAYALEFGLRVTMAFTLPAAMVLALGPIVLGAITIGTIGWTFAYVRRSRARARAAGLSAVLEATSGLGT